MKKLFKIIGIIVVIAGAIAGIYVLLKKLGVINCCKLNCDDCNCDSCDCDSCDCDCDKESDGSSEEADEEAFDSEDFSSIQPKSEEAE